MKDLKKKNKLKGLLGEIIACKYLANQGYTIVDKNFSCKFGELDIVAFLEDMFVVVEVKTRKNPDFSLASEAVDYNKIRNIKKSTDYFMHKHRIFDSYVRFDIIECYWESMQVRHIEDAFR